MKRYFVLLFALFGLTMVTPEARADDKIITIGTGSVSGVYYPAGGAICRLVNRGRKEHGIRCFSESTGGSVNNIDGLRDHEITLGIVQSDWQYKAYRGEGWFEKEGPFTDLRSVFSLHSEMFTIAVGKDSGVRTFADLKNKRVNIGEAGSGMREMITAVTQAHHWAGGGFAKNVELKPDEAVRALCDGKIDAMILAIGHPNGLVQELTSRCGVRLIPVEGEAVDTLLTNSPYYSRTAIPGGMYQGNAQNIPTFGVKATLVTTADADEETIYQLTKAVFENFDSFKTLHFVFSTLDRDRMVTTGMIAPIHPGALRYFKEVGLIKDDKAPAQ